MSSRIGDLAATSTVVSTDLFEKEQTAFAASEKITAAALKTALLGQIFTAGDQIKLGASPDAAGAVTIDASSFSTTALSIKNGATTATITLASGATLTIGPALAVSGSAPTLQLNTTTITGVRALYKAAESGTDKWGIGLDGSHQFIITNAALTTANLTITDTGQVTTRDKLTVTTGGLTVTAGGITVTAGASTFGATVTVSSGGASITGGLTVATLGATISGLASPVASGNDAIVFGNTGVSPIHWIVSQGTSNPTINIGSYSAAASTIVQFVSGATGTTVNFKVAAGGRATFYSTDSYFTMNGTVSGFTGSTSATLGTTSPAATATPTKWVKIFENATATTFYIPVWQ